MSRVVKDNVLSFPGCRQPVAPRSRLRPESVWFRGLKAVLRGLRWLLRACVVWILRIVLALAIVAARLGSLMFGLLSLGFAGKCWLHWGQPSVWTPVAEFTASFLIFCLLAGLLGQLPSQSQAPPALVRLSWLDRLLLVTRR